MKLTRTITQARGARTHWANTQENVFCTRALIDYADKFEAVPLKMTAQATLDAQPLGSVQLAAGRSAVIDKALDAKVAGAAQSLRISGDGDGSAYVPTTLRSEERRRGKEGGSP